MKPLTDRQIDNRNFKMVVKQHAEGVYEVENFLNEYEIDEILSFNTDKGFIQSHPGNVIKSLDEDQRLKILYISDRLMKYFDNAHSNIQITNIRRLKKGESMPSHIDGGYENNKKTIVFGVVIYLNDNFEGGEIKYLDLGLSIKPKKGSLLFHSAQLSHKVLLVTNGERYSLTSFIYGDKNTAVKL